MLFLFSVIAALVSFFVWRTASNRAKIDKSLPVRTSAQISGLGVLFFLFVAIWQCFTVIPAGTVGVIDFFGTVSDNTLKSGINMVNPMANIVKFSVKTQELKEDMDVPSKEGLMVQLEISVLFHLDPEKTAEVYKTIGPNYIEIILEPQFRSVVRGITAGYDARALYTSEREQLAQIIHNDLQKVVLSRGIIIETTPLRRIGLPPGLTQSIEQKLQAEQESQRMQFTLQKERQEAERKRIEAQGISDFQNIVTKGISEPLLRWKGIEATEKLAVSQNAKIVIIGSGKDGLPVILDTK
jgi:regulator of protease activity HflC (stomatin/prohibitin superfamily)